MPWTPREFAGAMILLALALLGAHVGAARAQSAQGVAYIECGEYATWARRFAVLRQVEAKLELVIEQMRKDLKDTHGPRAQALAREARIVFAEARTPSEAGYQAYKRCWAVLGKFGPEV